MQVPLKDLGKTVGAGVKQDGVQAFQEICEDLYKEVQEHTPVDTGRAKANWNISENTPDFGVDVGSKDIKLKEFNKVYISNGLPYVDRLDNGHSKQAVNGIVEPAFASVRNKKI